MKIAFLAAFVTVCSVMPLAAQAQDAQPNGSLLTVAGNGTVERAPDEARLNVTIVSNADVAAQSAGDNTRAYDAFVARTAKLGLARDAVRTTFYNVQFVPYPPKGLPPEQRQARYGYITTRNIVVTVTPLENVGKAIDAATASGVEQVGDVSFDLRNRKAAYSAALVAAMNDAKSTALTLAGAGGFHLMHIRSVDAGAQTLPIRPLEFGMMRAAVSMPAATPPPTDIQPSGPISVSAQVRVTYEIR